MAESSPPTATKNLTFDPTCFDTVSRREKELCTGLSGPGAAKMQPKYDADLLSEEFVQLDADVTCQENLFEDEEWVLVQANAPAKPDLDLLLDDGKQPLCTSLELDLYLSHGVCIGRSDDRHMTCSSASCGQQKC